MPARKTTGDADRILRQVEQLERSNEDGELVLGARGPRLHVSHLGKVWFPEPGVTKGDVMRYYVHVAPYLLPILQDRALSLKRFPNGVGGKFFFQQKAPADPPAGVRVETLESEAGEQQERLVGGSLATLLYCVQLGAFECNPWNARVTSPESPTYSVIDLDPGPRAPYRRVVEIARWVHEVLEELGLRAVPKTSGATGMHIVLPLPRGATEETAERVARVVSAQVAKLHPKEATIERSVRQRGDTKVYVDYGQNALGKTLAAAYTVRATAQATVSAPLSWEELTDGLDPRAFTVETVPARIAHVGDLWGEVMRRPNPARLVTSL